MPYGPTNGTASITDTTLTYTHRRQLQRRRPDHRFRDGRRALGYGRRIAHDHAGQRCTRGQRRRRPHRRAHRPDHGRAARRQRSADIDGDTLSFAWSATGVTFDNASAVGPTGQFALGSTDVTLTVTDPDGLDSQDVVNVQVQDTTPPEILYDTAALVLWPPNHKMVTTLTNIRAVDLSGETLTVSVSITSSEAVDANGSGNTDPDWSVADDGTSVDLRAERAGNGTNRVYTIALSATDGSGNATVDTVEVTVPHSQGSAKLAGTPLVTTLLPNYPNPFNASTQLSFFLPTESAVAFEIYSVLGTKVRTLEIPHLLRRLSPDHLGRPRRRRTHGRQRALYLPHARRRRGRDAAHAAAQVRAYEYAA